ncbi:MAG: phage Gp37/Gp68 family protein [Beijerinckiaceae bacterium]|nr:phage Gp37/Gp68 family protein [Beijerinckiaceae bacterium]
MSNIEWTEATWNPIVGCTITSPGCTNCYAMKMAGRIERMGTARHYDGTTLTSKAGSVWTGKLALAPEHVLLAPLRRRKPTTWFVNSMSDLFHEDALDAWIDRVFAVMALTPQHTYQVLTKRSDRMRAYVGNLPNRDDFVGHAAAHLWGGENPDAIYDQARRAVMMPLPNVWLGVSAEDQRRADERIPDLLATPAAIRFVSAEPLLGPIDFMRIRRPSPLGSMSALPCEPGQSATLDWIIVGGESGPGARHMEDAWAESIVQQCAAAGTAAFVKQMGGPVKARMRPIPAHLMVRQFPEVRSHG